MFPFAKLREGILNYRRLLLTRKFHVTCNRRLLNIGQFSGKRNTHRIDGEHNLIDAKPGLIGNLFDRRIALELFR